MNALDLVIVVLLVVSLVAGTRSGALPQILGLSGAALGVVLVVNLVPVFGSNLDSLGPDIRPVAVLLILFMGMALGEAIGSSFGTYLRSRVGSGILDSIDRAGGGVIGFVQAALIVWLAGGLVAASDLPTLSAQAQRSVAIRALDSVLPPPATFTEDLRQLLDASGLPDLFLGLEPLPAPPVDLPGSAKADAIARSAVSSTVRVEGSACGFTLSGTGFVVRSGYVLTNAHVIAGSHDIAVSVSGRAFDAVPVFFDPQLDVAILHAPSLGAPALRLASTIPPRGTVGAALGHPLGGPLVVVPAAVTRDYRAEGRDLYGRPGVVRNVLELQAAVRRGDSGGPLVLGDGSVGGVIFAEARNSPDVGYALAATDVSQDVSPALGRTAQVDTGPCIE